ncbi:hypothetical protein NM688_g6489 [Phlebia brevispora]|uniref:Uncharacterized protein n=1 Tax=Phlebia brevispora TaxID=194682 RepID=A0ACC1SFQ1_9APHY|nr:hypothetical protein NM688_g6489 [Phlebia brevispora]
MRIDLSATVEILQSVWRLGKPVVCYSLHTDTETSYVVYFARSIVAPKTVILLGSRRPSFGPDHLGFGTLDGLRGKAKQQVTHRHQTSLGVPMERELVSPGGTPRTIIIFASHTPTGQTCDDIKRFLPEIYTSLG